MCSSSKKFTKRKKKPKQKQTRGVSHCGLAIHIKKYLKAKEELWKLKYFKMQKHNPLKNLLKQTKNPSRYYNFATNLNTSQIIIFQKSSYNHRPKIP
jgi:hypothetical protein